MPTTNTLIDTIGSRNLRAVAAHWRQARGAQMMPAWQDLRPSAMARQLPLIWVFKYDQQMGKFEGRLMGDEIRQLLHKNIRGLSLEDVFAPDACAWVHALLDRVVRDPSIYWGSGQVLRFMGRHGFGERLVLPLSSDGVSADGVLGITEYHYRRPAMNANSADAEKEKWFCLRPLRQTA